ncbi:energy transducer TonB [Solitalea lacus]|uniref:energy transducer TonB n=1 Tax=Solitalea lacus TaxID=2911172 RepID=UPI001EDB05E8|nr:energy transducer TonB [Solitalea lacus]UKJ08941.1 energy transducer TonB [Solitalea lacus]
MAYAQHKEENNSGKAFMVTTTIYVVLVGICFWVHITNPYTPLQEQGEGGIVVNYGTSDVGMGTDYTSMEEPSISPNANNKIPEEKVENIAPTKPSEATKQEDALITQDNEDAPAIKTAPDKVVKTEPKQPVTTTKTSTETAKEQLPKVNPNALYKGKKTQSGIGGGDGTGNEPGNQGKITGDPNSTNYNGTGTGNGGVALTLEGRKFLSRPSIEDDGQQAGKVAVKITVDRDGNITAANAGARGTTISNTALWKKCERAVLQCKLNPINSGPETQIGMVVITFRVE